MAWKIFLHQDEQETEPTQLQQFKIQSQLEKPLSLYAASSNPNVMYLHEAMCASDWKEFMKATDAEIAGHEKGQHWIVVPHKNVLKGTKVLDAGWALCPKRKINTCDFYMHKVHLNVHDGQQEHRVNYWDTYAPVAMWPAL